MKKLLTLLLVVAMVLGIVSSAMAATTTPSTVAGSKFSDIAGNKAEGDITLLAVKNIMKGDAGATTVRPDSTITRAEFAAMVVRMLGKETLAASLAQIKPATKDEIPAWAWGYVNLATSMGIMKGYPDGTFLPNNNVTFAEALAMLERAIGLDKKTVGVWPTNVLVVAYDYDLVDGVDAFADVPATRADVAIMMVNTMYTDKFLATDSDGVDHFGAAILDATTVEGVVSGVNASANSIDITGHGTLDLATSVSLVGAKTFADLLNVNVKAVSVSDKVVFIEVTDDANVVVGTFKKFAEDTNGDEYLQTSDGSKYYLADAFTTKLNTVELDDYTDLADKDSVVLNLVDGKVVYIDATRVNYQNSTLDAAAVEVDDPDYHISIHDKNDAAVANLDITTSTPVTIDGVAKKVTDLKAHDVVYVTVDVDEADGTPATTVLKVEAFRATIKGEITAVKVGSSTTTVTLKLADGTSKDIVLSTTVTAAASDVGSTVEYRLNKEGKARYEVSYSATNNVGYVTDFYTTTTSSGDKFYVVLDVAGVSKTFQVGGTVTAGVPDAYTDISGFGTDTFIEYTTDIAGKLDTAAERTPTGATGTVVAVDAANGIVVVKDSGDAIRTFGVDGLSVYEENDDGTYTSVGLSALAKDADITFEAGEYDLLVIPN